MRVTLFKLKKPKRFSYKPRHYDPDMEDLHARIRMIEAELKDEEELEPGEHARLRIRNAWRTPEARKAANNTSTIRIAFIALILFALFYVYFFTDYISG